MQRKLIGVAGLLIATLAACSDSPVAPGARTIDVSRTSGTTDSETLLGSVGDPTVRYLCRNTFEVSNSWRVPAAMYWKVEGTSAQGHVEVPAGSSAAFDATPSSEGRTVLLFADAARTVLVGQARNTRRNCIETMSGDARRSIAVASSCGATVNVRSSFAKGVRINWLVPETSREGIVSVPAASTPSSPATLSFDVPNAASVRIRIGTNIVGIVSLPSATSCREGAVLSWRLLGAATTSGGAAVQSVISPQSNAIFTSDGPDYGPGRVWRIDLASNQPTELPSLGYPNGKYRQLVHDPVRATLISYWDGLGQAYEMPDVGGTWTPIGTASGNSEEYYEATAFWNPVTQAVNVWGGYGFGSFKNALWSLDATSGAWSALQTSGALPWGRIQPSSTVDAARHRLFITGGEGSSSGQQSAPDQQRLSDLWSLDLVSMQWTNLIPVGRGASAYQGAIAYVPSEDVIYRFGGSTNGALTNQLFRVPLNSPSPAFIPAMVYGTLPSPRTSFGLHYDAPRHRLVLVSGNNGAGYLNDLWELRLP